MAVEGLGFDSWLKKVFFPLFLAVYVFVLFCFFFTVFFYLLAAFNLITFRPHNSLTSCFLVNVFLVTFIFFTGINLYIPSAAQAGQQQKLSLTLEE